MSLSFWLTDLELGSEDDPVSGTSAGHATHPIRKRIAIKLRQGGKGRSGGGASGKKAKTKSAKDTTNDGGQAGRDIEGDTQFGIHLYILLYIHCVSKYMGHTHCAS